ncbi:hypothetical protein JOM56_006368 [Amanita muscaria]
MLSRPMSRSGITVSDENGQRRIHSRLLGDYDGLTSSDIRKINPTWDIWTDGCPGGESVEEMQARVDGVIAKVCRHDNVSHGLNLGRYINGTGSIWKTTHQTNRTL